MSIQVERCEQKPSKTFKSSSYFRNATVKLTTRLGFSKKRCQLRRSHGCGIQKIMPRPHSEPFRSSAWKFETSTETSNEIKSKEQTNHQRRFSLPFSTSNLTADSESSQSNCSVCTSVTTTEDTSETGNLESGTAGVNLVTCVGLGSQSTISSFFTESYSLLQVQLLKRYRHRLHFVMCPIPTQIGSIPCKVRVTQNSNKTKTYSLLLQTHQDRAITLLVSTTRQTIQPRFLQRRTKNHDIKLGGMIDTSIGRVSLKGSKGLVCARSFKQGYDHNKDEKGAAVSDARNKDLSMADLHTICSIKQRKKSGCKVHLDGTIEGHAWDGIQSITGFYGMKGSWPYKTSSKDSLVSLQSNLFNKQSRCLDVLGDENDGFTCDLTINEPGNKSSDTLFSLKESSSSLLSFLKASVAKSLSLERKDEPVSQLSEVCSSTTKEYNMDLCWPLSPIQAFGLFLAVSDRKH